MMTPLCCEETTFWLL